MLTPVDTFDYAFFTGEVSLLQVGDVGARVIQSSAHVHITGGGAVKLLLYRVTWPITQVGGDLLPLA